MWKIRMEILGLRDSLDKKKGEARLKGCNAIFSSPLSRLSKNETPVGQNRNRLSTSPRSLFHCMRNSFEYRAAFASDRMARRRRRRKRRIRVQVSHLTCRSKETLSFRISDPVFVPISFPQFRLLFSERTIISNESNRMRKGEYLKIWFYPKPWSSWRPTWRATTQPLSWSRPSVWWTCASSAKGSGCRDTGPTRWSTCALCSRNKPAHRTSRTRYTTPLRMASILQHSTWSFHRNFTDRFFDYKKERKKK